MFQLMISLCGFASAMSGRILDPVVTNIAGDFGSSVASVALLTTAYAIPFAVSQPVLGPLGDLFPKTFIVKAAVALLALFSAASALAPTLPLLFAARILGGAAGADVVPIGLALIGDRVPLSHRQLAINWFIAMTLFGQLVGAGVAGMIAHAFGWRNVLWFSTAIVFAVAIATAALLSHADTRPRQPAGASAALKNYRALLGNPLSCVFFGVVFVEGACIYGSLPFIGQYLQALGKGGVRETGIVISGIAIGGLAFAFALPMLVRFLRLCIPKTLSELMT